MNELYLTMHVTPGAPIGECVRIARRAAMHLNVPVKFEYTSVVVWVTQDPDETIEQIVQQYEHAKGWVSR